MSRDSRQWGKPVAKGEFAKDEARKQVLFDTGGAMYAEAGITGQYIRLVVTSGFGNDPYATIADLDVIAN